MQKDAVEKVKEAFAHRNIPALLSWLDSRSRTCDHDQNRMMATAYNIIREVSDVLSADEERQIKNIIDQISKMKRSEACLKIPERIRPMLIRRLSIAREALQALEEEK